MRQIAFVEPAQSGICRAMIYNDGQGAWVFLYDRLEDAPCVKDYWFEEWKDAEAWCHDELGIDPWDWKAISDPLPGQAPHLVTLLSNPDTGRQPVTRDFSAFRTEAHRCAMTMFEQARYIQGEMDTIRMPEVYRQQVEQTCAVLIGTKFDAISEMMEWDDAPDGEWLERTERIVRWLSEAVRKLDNLVHELRTASDAGIADTSAYALVTESAANILASFGRVKAAASSLQVETGN